MLKAINLQAVAYLVVLPSLMLASCASPPHDTLGFRGVVYSKDAQYSAGQTIPVAGVLVTRGGGTLVTYLLKLEDGSKYAVRSYNQSFQVGNCLAVYMNSERAKSQGYLNVKETTVVAASDCKAEPK